MFGFIFLTLIMELRFYAPPPQIQGFCM